MRVVLQMLVVQFSFSSFIWSAVVALLLIVCVLQEHLRALLG